MKNKFILFLFILLNLAFNFNFCFANEFESENKLDEATLLYNNAIDLYKEENIEKSIELFTKACKMNSNFYEARYNLAQILMSQNKDEEALKYLNEILHIRPYDPETLYTIGKIHYKNGFLAKAHKYLILIDKSAPQYESAQLLLDKISKRQAELDVEFKIKERQKVVNEKGRLVGTDLFNFQAPSGVTIDKLGNIYVASFAQNTIYKILPNGQKIVFSNSPLIKGPIGLSIDNDNNLYVANYSANNILKINQNNSANIFADVQKPYCIIYSTEQNRLYVTEQGTNNLVKFDL